MNLQQFAMKGNKTSKYFVQVSEDNRVNQMTAELLNIALSLA